VDVKQSAFAMLKKYQLIFCLDNAVSVMLFSVERSGTLLNAAVDLVSTGHFFECQSGELPRNGFWPIKVAPAL